MPAVRDQGGCGTESEIGYCYKTLPSARYYLTACSATAGNCSDYSYQLHNDPQSYTSAAYDRATYENIDLWAIPVSDTNQTMVFSCMARNNVTGATIITHNDAAGRNRGVKDLVVIGLVVAMCVSVIAA